MGEATQPPGRRADVEARSGALRGRRLLAGGLRWGRLTRYGRLSRAGEIGPGDDPLDRDGHEHPV